MDALIETLAWCSPLELAELMHPRDGLATVCKFLPTAADIHGFLREKHKREDEIEAKYNPHTTWKRLDPIPDPAGYETDAERRRAFVTQTLGYNPAWKYEKPEPRVLSTDDMPKTLDLKSPVTPASDELKQLLIDTGHGHLVSSPLPNAA